MKVSTCGLRIIFKNNTCTYLLDSIINARSLYLLARAHLNNQIKITGVSLFFIYFLVVVCLIRKYLIFLVAGEYFCFT